MAGGPEKERVIDALVLAFQYSEMSGVVGTDALRSVVSVEYADLVQGNRMDMSFLWDLLQEQPGFTAQAALAPLCLFETWAERLDLEIDPAPALAELSPKERAIHASQVKVPGAELRLIIRSQTGEGRSKRDSMSGRSKRDSMSGRSKRDSMSGRSKRDSMSGGDLGPQPSRRKQRPPWLGWVAGLVAAIAFGFTGVTMYSKCGDASPEFESFSGADLGGLPATSIDRLGAQLRVQADAGWSQLPQAERNKQLQVALRMVEDRGIQVIAVRVAGAVVSTVQKTGSGGLTYWHRQ